MRRNVARLFLVVALLTMLPSLAQASQRYWENDYDDYYDYGPKAKPGIIEALEVVFGILILLVIVINPIVFPISNGPSKKEEKLKSKLSDSSPSDALRIINRFGGVKTKVGNYAQTPLHFASVCSSNPEVIVAIVNAGADVNAKDKNGWTPLHWAILINPNSEVITALLNAGADVNAKNNEGSTPLHLAANHSSDPEVTTLLLNAGADLNARDNEDWTPLHFAVWGNPNPEIITLLLNAGADVNARSNYFNGRVSPLHCATDHNSNPEVITWLLNAGADVQATCKNGHCAIDYAKDNKCLKGTPAFETLRSATLEAKKISVFISLCGDATPREVQAALNAGADVNARDRDGSTPLQYAAGWNPNSEVIKLLLETGADVNARQDDGSTPLQNAAWKNPNPEIIKLLLNAGADVNARNINGWTPLHWAAAYCSNPMVVTLLLKAGANGNARGKGGERPIDLAQDNKSLKNTPAYWELHDASF